MHDNLRKTQVVHLGDVTVSGTTPATSDYVDLRGFDECTIMVACNTVTDAGTASGFTVTIQHSEDTTAAGAATITASSDSVDGSTSTVVVTSDSADDTNAGGVGYVGGNRYVGASVTGTTGSDADISVYAILGGAHREATTFIGTPVART